MQLSHTVFHFIQFI